MISLVDGWSESVVLQPLLMMLLVTKMVIADRLIYVIGRELVDMAFGSFSCRSYHWRSKHPCCIIDVAEWRPPVAGTRPNFLLVPPSLWGVGGRVDWVTSSFLVVAVDKTDRCGGCTLYWWPLRTVSIVGSVYMFGLFINMKIKCFWRKKNKGCAKATRLFIVNQYPLTIRPRKFNQNPSLLSLDSRYAKIP